VHIYLLVSTFSDEFPSRTGTSSHPIIKDGIENFDDYEDEEYFYLLEEKDYPGLIQYCKNRAAENPGDLYAKANLIFVFQTALLKIAQPVETERNINHLVVFIDS
jgi:hypothetical protein